MSLPPIWLLGTLASHPRGKVLVEATDAIALDSLPKDHGMCVAFGSDFQDHTEALQRDWTRWAEISGRILLLIPPFKVVECKLPTAWRIYRPQKVDPAGADTLARLLAPEVRFELTGSMQVATDVIGAWKGGGLHTAYYRKHPDSGLFAITCLPLWSLTVLDHRDAFTTWLNTLGQLAGEPAPAAEAEATPTEFRPTRDHFAMMLHLCERSFASREEALAGLADSPVLAIPENAARNCIDELETAGLAVDGKLTETGRSMLLASPYAVYAAAMEESRR